MKRVFTIAMVLVMAFAFAVPVQAINIPVSNDVYIFAAGPFTALDGWYHGEINVGWYGNGNNTAPVTWSGNTGEVVVTPYTVESNKQRSGALAIQIEQTVEEQTVVFTLTRRDKQTLSTTVVVPALYSGPITFDVLRTAIDPGYYFSGALIHLGVTVTSAAVDKDTFYAKARVTEANGAVEITYGCNAWDPEKADYVLGDGWARWNILDAVVTDADGNPVDQGEYVRLDIDWDPRSQPSGTTGYCRYEVPATRAGWYRGTGGYFGYAAIELEITQQADVPGIASATYVQDETLHDPLFNQFEIKDYPGGYKYAQYTPPNASEDNKRPIFFWFHGTGERYNGANAGANIVANRVLAFAEEEFQNALGGAYVVAPQSTTAGFSASNVAVMDALISTVVAENHVDPDRVYIGGLSMGSFGMATLMTYSTNPNQIPYAAAILVSGGSINATQAATVASKGIAVYLLSNAGDFLTFGHPAAYNNLINAGADAKIYRYPSGPTFDGKYYYGAHDTWIYFYNNQVVDENGETMFEWLASKSR